MQGDLSLLRQSFHQYIMITLPYITNNSLKNKGHELCQLLKDAQRNIVEIYQQVSKLQIRLHLSASPQKSIFYNPVGSPKNQAEIKRKPKVDQKYYMKSDSTQKEHHHQKSKSNSIFTPSVLLSPERNLKVQGSGLSQLQTSVGTNDLGSFTRTHNSTNKSKLSTMQLIQQNPRRLSSGIPEFVRGLSSLKSLMSTNGWKTQRPDTSEYESVTPIQRNRSPDDSQQNQSKISKVNAKQVKTSKTPLELFQSKKATTFVAKDSILKQISLAQIEIGRGQHTLGCLYRLTSETKQSWFHDTARIEVPNNLDFPRRQSAALKKNIIYAKMDPTQDNFISTTPRELFFV